MSARRRSHRTGRQQTYGMHCGDGNSEFAGTIDEDDSGTPARQGQAETV